MLMQRRAQSAVFGFLLILVLVAVAAGLVDTYRLFAARNWAYTVAQEAALTGASRARDWSSVASTGDIRLDAATAQQDATDLVTTEMANRGITNYDLDVRILPDPTGGTIVDYPPLPVRLGAGRGSWVTSEPAVGVYLAMPVHWMMLDTLGIVGKTVTVFASAGVAH
jgi:hypothetical protein